MILQHINSMPIAPTLPGQINEKIPDLIPDKENSTAAIVVPHRGIDPLAYYFALDAMPLIDDRIKFSAFATRSGQPIKSLREWLRAIEAGEWGC